ncbi:DUF4817 domain-containing protein [Nephila pilipes]|uniref:DUF4817 domain-containing protein n=1 Tax=Nephila pilipes TaxID=299642 RepID=A0A8X6UII9_NEPPI|nr:DUF4817 domain-containing protein [Nephila pilipes]
MTFKWGIGKPLSVLEDQRDSRKVNVFCAMSAYNCTVLFFFIKRRVAANVYIDILEQWLMPHLNTESTDCSLQQDGVLRHRSMEARTFLNQHPLTCWIGLTEDADDVFCSLLPRLLLEYCLYC